MRKTYTIQFKDSVRRLRRSGLTHREIAKKLSIAYSTASFWTRDILLSADQKIDIQRRKAKKIMTPEYRANLSRKITAHLAVHPRFKYTDEDLLKKIKSFHQKNGRIPLKKEFNALRIYRLRFGSWNRAIKLAGFKTNPVLFAHKHIANDGHKCDSFTEKVIDDWLYDNKITHSRNFHYGKTKMTGDFLLEKNRVLEFFGLAGEQEKYDLIIQRKRALAQKLKFRLIEIYPKDIYPVNHLAELITKNRH